MLAYRAAEPGIYALRLAHGMVAVAGDFRDGHTDPIDETAALLLRCCPASARRFAIQMHERLCERSDHDHAAIWLGVIARLKDFSPDPKDL